MMTSLDALWEQTLNMSLFWLLATVLAYLAGLWLYQKAGRTPWLLPVLTGVIMVSTLLLLTDTPYPDYADHVRMLLFMIGPATVALAVPLYAQLPRIRRALVPIALALLAGSVSATLSAIGIAWLLGGSLETFLSIAPKSATMPIAMEVSELTGGIPSLTTVSVALTGIFGAITAGAICSVLGIKDSMVRGFSLGLTAHAIGVVRGLQEDETSGAFAALGMGLNGIATALLVPILLAMLGLMS